MYLFSTLRPDKPPAGSLRLSSMDENWLHALVFLAIVALGLAIIRLPLSRKLGALALLVAVVVLAGVFLPILSKQVLDGVFASALFLVFVAWLAYHVMIAPPQWKITVVRNGVEKPPEPPKDKPAEESPFATAEVVPPGETPPASHPEGGRSDG
jgi:hypothetical protein